MDDLLLFPANSNLPWLYLVDRIQLPLLLCLDLLAVALEGVELAVEVLAEAAHQLLEALLVGLLAYGPRHHARSSDRFF